MDYLKVSLLRKSCNFDDATKFGSLCVCKIKLFWNKIYNVKTSYHDANNKILSRESNYIIDVAMWPKIGKYNILKRKFIIIRSTLIRKLQFFEGYSWFRFNNFGLALGMTLKISSFTGKGLRLKVRKMWRQIPTFVEYTGGKTRKDLFSPFHPK